jgi:hypothetical protein
VVGEVDEVVVVAGRRLTGVPKTAPVIGDHALSGIEHYGHLLLPRVAIQGIAVDQHHGLA